MKVIVNVVLWIYIKDRNYDYFTLLYCGSPSTTLLVT